MDFYMYKCIICYVVLHVNTFACTYICVCVCLGQTITVVPIQWLQRTYLPANALKIGSTHTNGTVLVGYWNYVHVCDALSNRLS